MVILFGPVLMLALFSFNDSSIISLPWEGFTTHWYEDAWNNQQAKDAIVNSVLVASFVTVVSIVLGTAAAWGLTRLRFFGRGAVAGLHGSVLVVPWLIIGVAGLIFFSEFRVSLSLRTVALMHLVVTFPLVVAIVSAGPRALPALARGGRHRPRRLAASDAALRGHPADRPLAGGRRRSSPSPGRSTTSRSRSSRAASTRRSRSGSSRSCASRRTCRWSTRPRP